MKQKGIDSFVNQRIWVIGASSGIGEACAKAFIKAGAKVALSSRRAERLNTLAQAGAPGQTLALPLDVTQQEQLNTAYQSILEAWGGLDLLLFVSGVYTPLRADNFDFEIAQKTIDANLLGPMRAVGIVLPNMLKNHAGHIAIVGSVNNWLPLLSTEQLIEYRSEDNSNVWCRNESTIAFHCRLRQIRYPQFFR